MKPTRFTADTTLSAITESMNRVQEHLKKEAENRNVVPLKREKA
jgi:hypothetical protein